MNDTTQKTGRRNRYFKNKLVTASDFKLEQDYGIDRRRLLNQAVLGWGVVGGLTLRKTDGGIECSAGLALDRDGRELHVPTTTIFCHKNLMPIEKHRDTNEYHIVEKPVAGTYILNIHYAECLIDPVRTADQCGCDENEWNRIQETVVFSISKAAPENRDPCPCPKCDDQTMPKPRYPNERMAHSRLCELITHRSKEWNTEKPCSWNEFLVAINDPVPLAKVEVIKDACGHLQIAEIHTDCTDRRLVKNNDLLFDLIRGCDLTRIAEVSWGKWHRNQGTHVKPIPWDDFANEFGKPHADPAIKSQTTNFTISFSNPVLISSLTPDTIIFTYVHRVKNTGAATALRLPIRELEVTKNQDDCPPGTTKKVAICVKRSWINDEIMGEDSDFSHGDTRIEIEIRGDFIIDCNKQAIDANAIGLEATPSGNGTTGGTHLTTFLVAQKKQYHNADKD